MSVLFGPSISSGKYRHLNGYLETVVVAQPRTVLRFMNLKGWPGEGGGGGGVEGGVGVC